MIELVDGILAAAGITSPPVRLAVVAASLGIVLDACHDFPREWDARLLRRGARGLCWYNPRKVDTRIRFSVAHEIGHFMLHEGQGIRLSGPPRDPEEILEREADAFAAELLMPTPWMLSACLEHRSFDNLRDIFWVSKQAMKVRLKSLGLLASESPPPYTRWSVLDRDVALRIYQAVEPFHPTVLHASVTGDPYQDYLVMRGVYQAKLATSA